MLNRSLQDGLSIYRQCHYICLSCQIRTLPTPRLPSLIAAASPSPLSQTRGFTTAPSLAAKKKGKKYPRYPSKTGTQSGLLSIRKIAAYSASTRKKRYRNAVNLREGSTSKGSKTRRIPSGSSIIHKIPQDSHANGVRLSLEGLSGNISWDSVLHAKQSGKILSEGDTQGSLHSDTSPEEFTKKGRAVRTIRRASSDTEAQPAIELHARDIKFDVIDIDTPPVPKLAHGLQRVLFNRGVYQFRDLHSRVYNFDPALELITPINEIDFNSLKGFIPSSEDTSLQRIASQHGKRYSGSTSSMTGILKHLHFLISKLRPVNMDMLSVQVREAFPPTFTKITAAPEAVFLKWRNGSYAIDSDKEFNFNNILSFMGRYMEKLLTVDRQAFERHKRGQSNPITPEELNADESHHYSAIGNILMRSQLDAHDPRLPGTGMFDLKTRAVIPIRMDSGNTVPLVGYELRDTLGVWESYEREYADMLRSTLLKYSLQARMGRMDGIFVAYHNITRLFGFQYLSLNEMDLALHGQSDRTVGDTEFLYSVHILNQVLDEATAKFPEQSLRIHFETRQETTRKPLRMDVYVEPVTEDEISGIQTSKQAAIEEWERKLFHPDKSTTPSSDSAETTSPPPPPSLDPPTTDPTRQILQLSLTAHSLQDGVHVLRPKDLSDPAAWRLRYSLAAEPSPAAARKAYDACRARRKTLLDIWTRSDARGAYFARMLRTHVERGREWRAKTDAVDAMEEARRGGVLLWDSEEPVKRERSDAASAAPASSATAQAVSESASASGTAAG